MATDADHSKAFTDLQLIALYRQTGDKKHVGELYKRYSHLVYGLCLRYFQNRDESKDGVIRIFEKLFDELAKREIENFPGWLTFVSRNFCISELRKKKTEWEREKEYTRNETLREEPGALNEKEIQLNRLEDALLQLNPEQKTCIELFYLGDKTYKEIADISGFALNDVKSFIQNGKRNLKLIMTGKKIAG